MLPLRDLLDAMKPVKITLAHLAGRLVVLHRTDNGSAYALDSQLKHQ